MWDLAYGIVSKQLTSRQRLRVARRLLATAFVVAPGLSLVACAAADQPVPIRPVSLLALRYEATIPQRFDYTCGAASVATLLTYYWNTATTEAQVIAALRQRYSLDEIARRRDTGLSFDDLIFAADRLGFDAQGAQIALTELPKLQGPVIVQLTNDKFQHFVVLRRTGSGVYYVSDPIVGELAMAASEFRADFSGYALAIWRSDTPLPSGAKLMRPRDGVSVTNSMEKVLNAGSWAPHSIL